ncbi:MAG: helix-turn-helix transcriptional regulator [Phycisphaerae bacterium]|nr:helix-turn-helix transcriptional regulator [Phycisphaerae bacterium]
MSTHANIQVNHAWLRRMADAEDTLGPPSVGGMTTRAGAISTGTILNTSSAARRVALARLIELSRRRLQLTIADVACRVGVMPTALASIERGDESQIAPKAMKKLAESLALPPQALDLLARPARRTDPNLDDDAMQFATSAGPVAALSPTERAALDKFVATLAKPVKRRSKKKAAKHYSP